VFDNVEMKATMLVMQFLHLISLDVGLSLLTLKTSQVSEHSLGVSNGYEEVVS